MSPKSVSTLVLNHPLPLSAIELGRLVVDPLTPDDEFHQPASPAISPAQSEKQQQPGSSTASAEDPNITTLRLENFRDTLDRSRGTRLEVALLSIFNLSLGAAEFKSSSTTLRSALCVLRSLRSPAAYFRAACADPAVRDWVEERARRPRTTVYLVCGLKTLTDARVEQSLRRLRAAAPKVTVPVGDIALAAAGVPTPSLLPFGGGGVPVLDAELGLGVELEEGEELGYTAPGECVFAVQYRKICFSWFATKKMEKAYLERESRWKSYVGDRGDDDDEEDGIDAEVADPAGLGDLDETLGSLELDGEEFLFQTEEEAEDR